MSTMLSFASQNLSDNFLSENDIHKNCPAAFLTEGTNGVSNKYIVARTIDVVHDLAKLGWYPVQACQRKPQKESSGRFNFHAIVFQNPDIRIMKTVTNPDGSVNEEVDCFPRILLFNSMDGCSCFRFMVGLLRCVCTNGLVVASDMFADLKIRHINYKFEDLQKLIQGIVDALPGQVDQMTKMKNKELSEDQCKELALKMFKIRLGKKEDEELVVDDETITDLLEPVRDEDRSNDLFTVFNVLQEKMMKGIFSYKKDNGKVRKAKAIKSFVTDMVFNTKAWQLAESYL